MAGDYVPEAGDIVWLDFTPQTGHEQSGRQLAVVLSPKAYNAKTGLLICVPITRQIKHYPFEVVLQKTNIEGAALADQVKSLDWQSRNAQYKDQIDRTSLQQIKAKLGALLG